MDKLSFASDYMEGAHPKIMDRLLETNLLRTSGYGTDTICETARNKIRDACSAPDAEIYFLGGGTQVNSMVVKYLLRPYQGVIAAQTGHIADHEAGAIESGGHKILCVPGENGKLTAAAIEKVVDKYNSDDFNAHIIMPGMVYISQPTESGTLYSLQELEQIAEICHKNKMYLFVDGARLAYALAAEGNDVTLRDMARLCDVFYIGGTKCGTLFGEAVVIPQPGIIPHFFTLMKQHGALMAKGRILGIQFEVLFTNGLYFEIGRSAVGYAERIRQKCREKGIPLYVPSTANQVFLLLTDAMRMRLETYVDDAFWEKPDPEHTVIRLTTSWSTTEEDVRKLLEILDSL